MMNPRPRKSNLALFLDPTKKVNRDAKYLYQRTPDKLAVTNGHWLIVFPWETVPTWARGYFPDQNATASFYVDGAPVAYDRHSIDLFGFLTESVARCTTGIEDTGFVWAARDCYEARLFRATDGHALWCGVNRQYLDAITSLYPDAILIGSMPTCECHILDGDEGPTIGVIMPVRTAADWHKMFAAPKKKEPTRG